jgi:HJR/Mrr/RecB family endonuclease
MKNPTQKYWLHRVSHEWDVSKRLLENDLLSHGWGRIVDDKLDVISVARDKGYDAYRQLMKEHCPEETKPFMLYNFVVGMSTDDTVVVPLYDGKFAVYEITGETRVATSEERKRVDGTLADLGFVMPVKRRTGDIKRADYADNALVRCMKYWGTNIDITKIKNSVDDAVKRVKDSKPIHVKKIVSDKLAATLREEMSSAITDPKKFEQLIAWYFKKNGAETQLPSAKAPDKGTGDADVIAKFKLLGDYDFETVFYIQAKYHDRKTLTGEEAVIQISDYLTDHTENTAGTYKALVISAADDFTDAAKDIAIEKDVSLINGPEFAAMLIDSGISGIDSAFK